MRKPLSFLVIALASIALAVPLAMAAPSFGSSSGFMRIAGDSPVGPSLRYSRDFPLYFDIINERPDPGAYTILAGTEFTVAFYSPTGSIDPSADSEPVYLKEDWAAHATGHLDWLSPNRAFARMSTTRDIELPSSKIYMKVQVDTRDLLVPDDGDPLTEDLLVVGVHSDGIGHTLGYGLSY